MAAHPPIEDEASDDPTPVGPMRVARLWKRRNPRTDGSINTSLKAMDVLYDAGEPITRDELEARLFPRLDPYEAAYIKDWWLHQKEVEQSRYKRTTHSKERNALRSVELPSLQRALHTWITQVFLKRVKPGKTVTQTADGRLMPGSNAPFVARADGQVLRYTPETRKQFADEDREAHRKYLTDLEWAELMKTLPVADVAARAQLLMLLVRRLLIRTKFPLDERSISPKLNRLVSLADTPAVQKTVLQRALDALWTSGDAR
jgi:hypothetical protein